ncbi:UvrD-helicase domain-containing protein [Streptomyces harbinensis]
MTLYETPRTLSELDAAAESGALVLRAASNVDAGPWEYRLYGVGPDHSDTTPFVLVRVNVDDTVHEVATAENLPRGRRAEDLFGRLAETLDTASAADGPAAAERRILAEIAASAAPPGPMARIGANLAALRTLHTLRDEQRPATAAERIVLARWSSWGAIPKIFDPRVTEYDTSRAELRSLLTDEEWNAAEATTRNAHFTDPALVEPIWRALQDLGFQGGRVLEPGCGSGNFLAAAPPRTRITGVELDPVTAEIAAALHPDAEIRAESFVATRVPGGYYDAAIGNVPFDSIALTDPVHNPLRLATHNHFIVKALNLTRPGGLVAVITSRHTLDSMGKTARLEIADRADLVGAVRLPAGAHRRSAGTEAVTDVLILRRREGGPRGTPPDWIGLAPVAVGSDTHVLVNRYFAEHPERVLGTIGLTSTPYGRDDVTVRPGTGADLPAQLSEALATISREARDSGLTMTPDPEAAQRAAVDQRMERMRRAHEMFGDELQRAEGTLLDQGDGTFLQVIGGEITERPVFRNAADELRSLLSLRDTYVGLLAAESAGEEEQAGRLRAQLNQRYDDHTAKYGFLNARETRRDRRSTHGAFRSDPYAAGVYALEIYDRDSGTAKKSAIFTRAVGKPRPEVTKAETAQDALAISLNTYGEVRLGEITRLLGVASMEAAREALGDLVFNEPGSQRLIPAPQYLSGNVRDKLEKAEKILRMVSDEIRPVHPLQANVAALRRVLPPDKQPGDIEDVGIGATWIAPEYYEQFLQQLLQTRYLTVSRRSGADWEIDAPGHVRTSRAATKVYGTERRNAVDLAHRLLRRASLVIHPPKPDEDASPQDIQDGKRWAAEQTEQVVAKADELNRLFADWLWQDAERTKDVLATYNRLHNSYVPYQGDGSHLTFPGLSDAITPRPHQRAGVARALAEPGGSFFDYEVGFGKTLTIAMTLMEMKRLGTVTKPCVVVKNATVNDFRNDFLRAYPQARVLAIDSAEFTKETATTYVAQIANGDWDAVILPQSLFNRIPMSGRGQAQFVADQTAEYRARIHKLLTGSDKELSPDHNPGGDPLISEALEVAAGAQSDRAAGRSSVSRDTIKSLQGDLKRHRQRAEKNLVKQSSIGIAWEQTGIDFIAVDEVQDFANGAVGANNSELSLPVSAQARGLKVKLRSMAKAYGPKVGLGSTGTPFPNAMPQAYVMLDYFRPDLLAAAEISAFSSFQAQYLMEVVAPEISPEGIPRIKERIGAFRNARPFSQLWKAMADVKTKYDIQLPVPRHVSETVVVPATNSDREYMADIAVRAELVRDCLVDPAVDNLLKISNDGRMAAMDLRMVGVTPDGPGKLDAAADKIAQIWRAYRDHTYTDREGTPSPLPGALQLVFADRGTPSDDARKKGRFIAYAYLRDQLVARGVPEDGIRYAQSARTAEEKEELFADCRKGKVAVLIGSTDTMGVGVNVQDRAIALHHLDCPWRPSDVTQREGRIIRQFNQHFSMGFPVQIYRWVKEGSFDSFMWQTVERKARFIDQVRTGRDPDEQDRALDGDLGKDYLEFGEIKALATGNPLLLKKLQADEEVRQLEAAYQSWRRTNEHLRTVVDTADETLAKAQRLAEAAERAGRRRTETKGEAFAMELPDGTTVTRRQDAAVALRRRLMLMSARRYGDPHRWQHIATLGGQRFLARVSANNETARFTIEDLEEVRQVGFVIDDVVGLIRDGKPPLGLVSRLENVVEKLDGLHGTLLAVENELKQEIDRAQKLVDQPFTKRDKLVRARADQARLEAEIEAYEPEEPDGEDTAATPAPAPAPALAPAPVPEQPAAPYADRAEYWAEEQATLAALRKWEEEHGVRLPEGNEPERALALTAAAVSAASQNARRTRLLGLDGHLDWRLVDTLAQQARVVGEQWDREQRGPRTVSDTWAMHMKVRDHAARYRATVENPESAAFQRWAASEEPITVADEEATESIPGLSLFEQYTVTGPDGRSTPAANGVDLAAGIGQLIADGLTLQKRWRGLTLTTPDGSRFDIVPLAPRTPGSSNPRAQRLAVMLGRYTFAKELVRGAELVGETLERLRARLTSDAGAEAEPLEFEQVATALAASSHDAPADVLDLYDRLADAAEELADATDGETAALAHRLLQRTERHLGRLHAAGDNLFELLTAAADAHEVPNGTDPLGERPEPYSDNDELNRFRSLVLETYDRWPESERGTVSEAGALLRRAMWDARQVPDTGVGAALTAWADVFSQAVTAVLDTEQSESRTILADVAERAYEHHRRLAAHQLAADIGAAPYGPGHSFTDGLRRLGDAWNAWWETPTARRLAERPETRTDVVENFRQAHHAAEWAITDDGTLDEVTRHAAGLAHAGYALVLSLPSAVFATPGDHDALTQLVSICYHHAANCRSSARQPAAVAAVREELAAHQERLRAVPPAPDSATVHPTEVEIEHHTGATIVRGPTMEEGDASVRAQLASHGFQFSEEHGHWHLPTHMSRTHRNTRVRALLDGLSFLGRPHRMAEPKILIPPGEPYSSRAEATRDFEAMFAGYWSMRDTPAGRKLVDRGVNVRPDSHAVFVALEELRQGPVASGRDPFVHPAADVARRCTELARAAQTLAGNLDQEGYRAPVALRHFRTMTQYATLLASRINATAEREGLWDQLFSETAGTVQPQATAGAEATETRAPERPTPERAALIAERARNRGWQVGERWDDDSQHYAFYELTLKAHTDHGPRAFSLRWRERRGRYGYSAQHSAATHHGDRTARNGFRPALGDVERELALCRVVEEPRPGESTEAATPIGTTTPEAEAAQEALFEEPAPAPSEVSRLTREDLEALPKALGDEARLAVTTTLPLPDGTVPGALLLLRSVEPGTEDDPEPIVYGAQIVPENNLVSSSLEGRYVLSDLLAMPEARVLPLPVPLPWTRVRELMAMSPDEARRSLSPDRTPNGLFTLDRDDAGPCWVLRSAGSGSADYGRIDTYANLPATELEGPLETMTGFRSATEAVVFSERLAALTDSTGDPVDWARIPAAGELGSVRFDLDRQVLALRAAFDIEQGLPPSVSSAIRVWRLLTEDPDRPPAAEGRTYADRLRAGERIRWGSGPAGQLLEVLDVGEPHRTGLVRVSLAAVDDPDDVYECDVPRNLMVGQQQKEQQVPPTVEPPVTATSWSSRVRIVTENENTYVIGTGGKHWPEEAELRALLKKNRNFAYKEGRWTYQGPSSRRDTVVEEVRDYLREKDAGVTRTASPTPEYPPTPQQQRIIDACVAGRDVAVQALAGTGKTSTLQMVTRRMADKRIAYVAFNRSIADEARQKFPAHVTADTSHAFARAAMRNTPLRRKIGKAGRNGGARRPQDVADALGLTEPLRYRGGSIEPESAARIAMAAVRNFRESADPELLPRHLGQGWTDDSAVTALLGLARRAWEDIADPNSDKLFFTHDDYLKLWALTNPRLPFDMILFDEAQDINPVLKKVIQDQTAQTVVVGDSNQSIYEFRGAIDALKDWPADVVLPLTQSWRFGPDVAEVGNSYLRLLGSELTLEGNPARRSTVGPLSGEVDAVLTRTNVGAIGVVFSALEAEQRVALVGGGREIEDTARAAQDLQRGRRTNHPELGAFTSWHDVRDYAETEQDGALLTFVRLVERYSPEGLLRMMKGLVPEEGEAPGARPDLIVSTAHKAKGREWRRVRIGGDFPQPKVNAETGELELPPAEELRLAYVTVTRAKEELDPGSLDWIRFLGENATQSVPTKAATTALVEMPVREVATAQEKPVVTEQKTFPEAVPEPEKKPQETTEEPLPAPVPETSPEAVSPEPEKKPRETREEPLPTAEPETAREHLAEAEVSLNKTGGQLMPQLAALRDLLDGILGSADIGPVARGVVLPPLDDSELGVALAGARDESHAFAGAPEWESIGRLRQAEEALTSAFSSGTAASVVSTAELNRTVRSLTARALAHDAFALARRLEHNGQRDTDAWAAAQRLHRAATTQADRWAGNLPADERIDRAAEVRAAWNRLATRMTTRDGRPGRAQILMATGFESVKQHYHSTVERLGELAGHPLWRRAAAAFESAQEVFDKARLGTYRLLADDATLGTFRMLWARTVELIAQTARALLDRLDRGGSRDGLRWNAVHLLHHTAEEHLSHLRGHLPPGTHSPLGTYYNPPTTAEEPTAGAEGWEGLHRAAAVVSEADVASPVSLQSRMNVGYAEARGLLRRLEDLEIVGAPQRGRLREVLMSPEEAARVIEEARAAEEDAPRWNPTHEPFRTRWFDEVRQVLPHGPAVDGGPDRADMIRLLFAESRQVAQGRSDRGDAGQRANQAMELYLSGRSDEAVALLAREEAPPGPTTEAEAPGPDTVARVREVAAASVQNRHAQQQLHETQRTPAGVSAGRR